MVVAVVATVVLQFCICLLRFHFKYIKYFNVENVFLLSLDEKYLTFVAYFSSVFIKCIRFYWKFCYRVHFFTHLFVRFDVFSTLFFTNEWKSEASMCHHDFQLVAKKLFKIFLLQFKRNHFFSSTNERREKLFFLTKK